MDNIFYTNAELTEKSGVPQGSDLPQVNFKLLEFDLSSLPSGLTIYDIEWTSEGVTTDLNQAQIDKDVIINTKEYNNLVVSKIRVSYSQDDEFAMIAEGIEDATNASYVAYRAFVATCKIEAYTEVYGS